MTTKTPNHKVDHIIKNQVPKNTFIIMPRRAGKKILGRLWNTLEKFEAKNKNKIDIISGFVVILAIGVIYRACEIVQQLVGQ